jgi:hypothetical protein
MLAWLGPVFYLQHIIFNALTQTVWVAARFLYAKSTRHSVGILLSKTYVMINDTFCYRCDPSYDPFSRFQLFGEMASSC